MQSQRARKRIEWTFLRSAVAHLTTRERVVVIGIMFLYGAAAVAAYSILG